MCEINFFVKYAGNDFEFKENLDQKLRKSFGNGSKCGELNKAYQIYKDIPNLLLLNQNRFELKVYMLVASTSPLIAYYHDGFLKLSADDLEKSPITSLLQEMLAADMNEAELRESQTWSFLQLQNHLLENDYTTDVNWIENNLRKQLKEIMVHSLRMSQHLFENKSQLFEIFECKFVLDNDLKVWLIEINTNPTFYETSSARKKFLAKMLVDMFDLMYSYLRSRIKRVILFINKISKYVPTYMDYMNFEIGPNEFEIIKTNFGLTNINYLEKEFMPSSDNEFQKIIDENLKGSAIYSGIIPKECL